MSGELTELELVLDETLRKYPPAWVGPRRAIEAFEFEGHTVPARAFVNYCSWASHHLPDVFPEPEEFRPERFTAASARGAAQGRLRSLRRRLAHLHRDALRAARGAHHRHRDPVALHALAARATSVLRSARCRRSAPSTGLPMRRRRRGPAARRRGPPGARPEERPQRRLARMLSAIARGRCRLPRSRATPST